MARISFATTKEEAVIIGAIIRRAQSMADYKIDSMEAHMDLSACHANGCPMKFQEFLDAPDFDFSHDFFGIRRHINRKTGQLEDFFLPRFAQPVAA